MGIKLEIINKIILFFFKKILKKNKNIKNEVINYLKEESFDELKKVVENKENERVQEELNKEKKIDFANVKPGDVVLAKWLHPGEKEEDNIHLYRPFFVVGRSKKNLNGIYCTTKLRKSNEFFSLVFSGSKKTTYLDCSKIIQLSIDDFDCKAKFAVHSDDAKKVIKKMLNYRQCYNQIDFKTFFKKITFSSIVLCNNKFYKISGITEDGYKAYPLYKINGYNNISKYVNIFGKKYIIKEDEKAVLKPADITVITDEVDYHVYEEEAKMKQKRNSDKTGDKLVKKYRYGDVLSIKNTKNKIIYVTESNKKIYYVTHDDIDLFKGIQRIDKNCVNAYYDHLSSEEIKRLSQKLNKVFEMGNDDFTYVDLDKIISSKKK